jgi:hypothetical protein
MLGKALVAQRQDKTYRSSEKSFKFAGLRNFEAVPGVG